MFAASADNLLEDQQRFLRIAQESLAVKRHVQFLLWLQGDLQYFVPHEVLIAAWGDFSLGLIHYDIISTLPGVRTTDLAGIDVSPLIRSLFDRWINQGSTPFAVTYGQGVPHGTPGTQGVLHPSLRGMRSALVHGIRDQRGRHDCLYVALHSDEIPVACNKRLEMLLPYIDTALRQVTHLPAQHQSDQAAQHDEVTDKGLTSREVEIMDWVRKGKTNHEIGMILNISEFTVKNHLQRIFRKLDVINRAQAVSTFAQSNRNSRV